MLSGFRRRHRRQPVCRFQRGDCGGRPCGTAGLLFAGLLVVMIMRMLAEMAVATPDTGSFPPMRIKRRAPRAGIYHRLVILAVLGAGYSAGGQYCRHYSEFMGYRVFRYGYFH